MTGFRFRLERVRALREQHEDVAKQELAGALARRQACEAELEVAEQRLAQARESQTAPGGELGWAGELLARQAYLERIETVHRESLLKLGQREREVVQRRDLLTVAARERQALERLKTTRRAEHAREALRLESVLLDEIAGQAFHRSAA